jgi:ABC-2 type transport system ATP-binding protein
MLEIRQLTKTYPGAVRALDEVSLDIAPGLYGLLGPNGAGKSTLMRTLAALQRPDRGTAHFEGVDILNQPDALRRKLGYLPQEFGFYPNLSAEATLRHFAALKGVEGAERVVADLLAQVNLWDVRKKNVGGFSGGMKQRLGIAVALLGQPALVIVDEPTAGLDPTERYRFLNLLAEVGERATVILSTHLVEDVRELCARMAIIARGRVAAQGKPEDVIDLVRGRLWRRRLTRTELPGIESRLTIIARRLVAGEPIVTVASETDPGEGFTPVDPDLEDAYFFFTSPAPLAPTIPVPVRGTDWDLE